MSFHESARNGYVIDTMKAAIMTGSLWAIGSSWSVAIRSIVIEIIPDNEKSIVLGELGAAVLTTVIGMSFAFLTTLDSNRCLSRGVKPTVVLSDNNTRSQTITKKTYF